MWFCGFDCVVWGVCVVLFWSVDVWMGNLVFIRLGWWLVCRLIVVWGRILVVGFVGLIFVVV